MHQWPMSLSAHLQAPRLDGTNMTIISLDFFQFLRQSSDSYCFNLSRVRH